ncbi:hypothetical protein, conserved [Babesia ovata]|uniref:Uncharacterized protein n=1 Tax=Babesia ovata TaxID=189622 RepID=A0A2H6KIX7_9APIC|nr:uncharacterized protein BOVATA_044380 [Babesia ovata]GBE62945.1 hypothetical protein, conserved [Babesia ovata]
MPGGKPWMILMPVLSGFIGKSDEVEKAILNGLHSNVSQLEKLLEASCGGEGCCKDAGEAINNLNEFNEKLKKHLNEEPIAAENLDNILSDCKLNPSDGPLDKLNKEITQKIDDLTRQIDELKNDNNDDNKSKNASEIDKLSKSLESHNASLKSLETLKELCDFAGKVKSSPNGNCKDILNNLCTGLEKFLGYEKGNYTGSGIVYSDLDRLCDGVMAFLHSVLKDVYEKQPYKVGKESHLKSVVDALNEKLCSGHKGFKSAIVKVADGVREYNREVERSNESVKEPINDLLSKVGSTLTDKLNEITSHIVSGPTKDLSAEQVDKVKTAEKLMKKALKQCQEDVKKFNDIFNLSNNKTMKNAVEYLNPNLSHRIKCATGSVEHETERLRALSDKESEDFNSMQESIQEVLKEHGECVKTKITEKVTELVRYLKDAVQKIVDQLKKISGTFNVYVNQLGKWIDNADAAITGAETQVKKILDEVSEGYGSTYPAQLRATADNLKTQADELYTAQEYVKTKVQEEVQKAIQAVKTLEDAVRYDLNGLKDDISSGIREYFDDYVRTVRGKVGEIRGGPRNNKGLQITLNNVRDHAKGFDVKFKAAIAYMIDKMLSGGALKLYISWYKPAEHKERIAQEITNLAASGTINSNSNEVHTVLQSIKSYLENFASAIEPSKNASGISNKIDLAIKDHISNLGSYNIFTLEKAIKTILTAVHSAVNGAAAEINTFVTESKIKNIHDAWTAAEHLNSRLTTALEKGSEATTEAFVPGSDVDTKLASNIPKTINRILDNKIGQTGTHGKDSNKIVNLDKMPASFKTATSDRPSKKVALTAAITKIQTDVTGALAGVERLQTEFMLKSSEIHNGLSRLCAEIKYAADIDPNSAKKKLELLKNLITQPQVDVMVNGKNQTQKGLNKIHTELSELRKKLDDGPIKAATDFVSGAGRLCEQYLKPVHEHVGQQVQKAQELITTQARKNHVNAIKRLLTSFAEKVEKDLKPLPQDILHDLTLGFKGFMAKFEEHFITNSKSIIGIKDIENTPSPEKSPLSQAVVKLHGSFKKFFHDYQKNTDFSKDFRNFETSNDALQKMLEGLITSQHFNNEFSNNLQSINNELRALHPSEFGPSSTSMLQSLKEGLDALTKELSKAYLNTYEGLPYEEADKDKYAKAFITSFYTIHDSLTEVKEKCNSEDQWKDKKCCEIQGRIKNPLGKFMKRCGFKIGHDENSKDSELQYPSDLNGQQILQKLLAKSFDDTEQIKHIKECLPDKTKTQIENTFNITHLLECLLHHVDTFNEVSHLALRTKPRSPCNVYEMLAWCSGLTYNRVWSPMRDITLLEQFDDPEKENKAQPDEDLGVPLTAVGTLYLDAYPHDISYNDTRDALTNLCSLSYDLLTAIVGTGDAATYYACDYCTNTMNLYYPSNPGECLDMLLDILRRVYPVLVYLCQMCSLDAKHNGWRQCQYGKDVSSGNRDCNQHSDQPSDCRPGSPLMLYLTDGLPGHLPHQLGSVGCKAKCSTCSTGSSKMPCLTPLGFRAFSVTKRTGKELCNVLTKLCGNQGILTTLYSALNCLLGRPPATFPDVFSFYYKLVRRWNGMQEGGKEHSIQQAITDKITATVGCNSSDAVSLLDSCRRMYDSPSHFMHNINDVCDIGYLVGCGQSDCGYIMRPLNASAYSVFVPKFAGSYLSYLIYACSSIYNFLEQLKNSFCDISCYDHQCGPCLNSAGCATGKHGTSQCGCRSIVQCRGVSSVFYRYGLAYADAAGRSQIRCQQFCTALDKILQSQTLKNFLSAIDEFMFTVRKNFIWTLVALWSLSLLYLLHIAVVRLDVLRIRSHLRSPSSHRIAAQSLLAAARVKALANVKYFSP